LARVREQVAIAGVSNLMELNGGRLDAQTLGAGHWIAAVDPPGCREYAIVLEYQAEGIRL